MRRSASSAGLAVAFGGWNTGSAAISSSTSRAVGTARTTANAARANTPENVSLPAISGIAGSISMADLAPEVREALGEAGIPPAQLRAEAREAFRDVIRRQDMARARSVLSKTLGDIAARPGTFSEDGNGALDRLIEEESSVLGEEDITGAKTPLHSRPDISEGAVSSAAPWLSVASVLGLGAAAGAGALARRLRPRRFRQSEPQVIRHPRGGAIGGAPRTGKARAGPPSSPGRKRSRIPRAAGAP